MQVEQKKNSMIIRFFFKLAFMALILFILYYINNNNCIIIIIFVLLIQYTKKKKRIAIEAKYIHEKKFCKIKIKTQVLQMKNQNVIIESQFFIRVFISFNIDSICFETFRRENKNYILLHNFEQVVFQRDCCMDLKRNY